MVEETKYCEHSAETLDEWFAISDRDTCMICELAVPSTVLAGVKEGRELKRALTTLGQSTSERKYFDRPTREMLAQVIRKLATFHAEYLKLKDPPSQTEKPTTDNNKTGNDNPESKQPRKQEEENPESKKLLEKEVDEDENENPEVLCPISSDIPQEPVKLLEDLSPASPSSPGLPVVYEKKALQKWFDGKGEEDLKDPVTSVAVRGMVDYVDAKRDVRDWIERNLQRPEAQQWMLTRLEQLLSPKQMGEALMDLVRRADPSSRVAHLYGGAESERAVSVNNGSSIRYEFPFLTSSLDTKAADLERIRNIPGVRWVQECHDMRGNAFAPITAVGVESLTTKQVVQAIVTSFRASSLRGTLTLFEIRSPDLIVNRTSAQYATASHWWTTNQDTVQTFLREHPQVVCAYVDPAIRHGKVLKTLAFVVVVQHKGFIPVSQQRPLPEYCGSLRIDVRSGTGSPIAIQYWESPHPDACCVEIQSYIGHSIGSRSHKEKQSGTLGAVVEKQDGSLMALTAGHVAEDNTSYCAPAHVDRFSSFYPFRVLNLVETMQRLSDYKMGTTYIDAALFECTGFVTSNNGEQPIVPCQRSFGPPNGDEPSCFVGRTSERNDEKEKNVCYFQSGKVADYPAEGRVLEYFGRTSGQTEVKYVCSLSCVVGRNFLDEFISEDFSDTNTEFPNQLLFETFNFYGKNRSGDSGSLVWSREANGTQLDGVGVVFWQLAEYVNVSPYLFATPIQAVLDAFKCRLYAEPSDTNNLKAAARKAELAKNVTLALQKHWEQKKKIR